MLKHHRSLGRCCEPLPGDGSDERYSDPRFDLLVAYQFYDLPFESAIVARHLMRRFFFSDDVMDIVRAWKSEVRDA